jgi:hypothetical protein
VKKPHFVVFSPLTYIVENPFSYFQTVSPKKFWKIEKAPRLRSHGWAKGVEKPHFAVLCHRTYAIENPFSYFPNSFKRSVLGSPYPSSCIAEVQEALRTALRASAPRSGGLHVVVLHRHPRSCIRVVTYTSYYVGTKKARC